MMHASKAIKPLPYRVYYTSVLIVALLGFADSVYLTVSHYRVYNDIGYSSFCAISRSINCDTVSQSAYAILWGLPLPLWGVLGYLFYLLLLGLIWHPDPARHRLWPSLFLLSLGFSVYSLYLALISSIKIHSYCIMCIVDYAINFALLYVTWLVRKRFQGPGLVQGVKQDLLFLMQIKTRSLPMAGCFTMILIAAIAWYPHYWVSPPPLVSPHIKTGTTPDGYPWIGAADPEITITEFADYQCFQCNKIHYYLRRIIAENPEKIRLIHRHFPMDHTVNPLVKHPNHTRAGALALMAIYAAEKGRFWPMNDYLFVIARGRAPILIEDIAQTVGLDAEALKQALSSKTIRKKLRKDISDGIALGLTGTPGFIVDGHVYEAQLPPDIIKRLLE